MHWQNGPLHLQFTEIVMDHLFHHGMLRMVYEGYIKLMGEYSFVVVMRVMVLLRGFGRWAWVGPLRIRAGMLVSVVPSNLFLEHLDI